MDNNNIKYIVVSYELNSIKDDKREFVEKATEEQPFQFLSGVGETIEKFENNILALNEGDDFEFIIEKNDAYGEYEEERIIDVDKSIFTIDGKFDDEHIVVDAMIPLQNADGDHFYGKVMEITDDKVKLDLNLLLAGKDLDFKGKVLVSRPATNEEIADYFNRKNNHGCGCNCGSCGGGCEDCGEHDQEKGQGCGGCGCE